MVIHRRVLPYTGSSSVSPAVGFPAPAMASVSPKSNLDELWRVTKGIVMPDPLEKSKYPGLKFWERHMWVEWVNREKEKGTFKNRVQGEGVNSSFMEDEDGNRVHRHRQKQILDETRHTWCTMKYYGIDLKVYSKMPVTVLDYFRAAMKSKFPELQLCADHWKVDEIWHENFSSWQPSPQQSQKEKRKPHQQEPPSKMVGQSELFLSVHFLIDMQPAAERQTGQRKL
jgi:hypothetical protein